MRHRTIPDHLAFDMAKAATLLWSVGVLATALLLGTAAGAAPIGIVALGDSNTAGLWVGRERAFPAALEALLRSAGSDVAVGNAGISGDTLAGMLARLDQSVPEGTRLVILQGGYNDMRRGSSSAAMAAAVEAIMARLRARQVRVILCGLYDEPWAPIARRQQATFVPSTTCYDAGYRGFDGLHMNAAGHQVVAARLFPVVQALLSSRQGLAKGR